MWAGAGGDLRHRVSIQTRTESADGHGGFSETWATVATRRAAQVVTLEGRDLERASQIDPRAAFEVHLRYWRGHNDVLVGGRARLVWHDEGAVGDRTLELIGPPREVVPRTTLTLLAHEAR